LRDILKLQAYKYNSIRHGGAQNADVSDCEINSPGFAYKNL